MEHALSLNNREWELLAVYLEASKDREATFNQLKADRDLVLAISNKE
jgi:hypothetical protein